MIDFTLRNVLYYSVLTVNIPVMWTTVVFCGFLYWLSQGVYKCLNFRLFAVYQIESGLAPNMTVAVINWEQLLPFSRF